ncbi:hypothetical protein KL86DYS1_10708 [uncultured Dysgonomonas sp.]|uniref:Uncharacterized protein n=1 Tax=uncultured Dysgonomonas sp. TaxID=206096 RepID=A0A212J0E8_9BACT|nr:hypothetical protein KL86DYS1_10708 [uncultured Dysgonomonas sp.]
MQNSRANIDVIIVPAMKGSAPYTSFRESHSVEVIKPNPNSENAPILLLTSPYITPAVSNIIRQAAMNNMALNILSFIYVEIVAS